MHKRGRIVRNNLDKKTGQVTIFIIIAIVIVGAIATYFLLRGQIAKATLPTDIQPVYTTFLSCLEEETLAGVSVLESQGGYIQLPEFEQGSDYSPFSSQLDFLGNPIPYWYYISGNNFEKEQVPTKAEMEVQLENFINGKIRGCVYNDYYEQGFEINQGEPKADVLIRNNDIIVNLEMNFNVKKETESANINSHQINVKTNLGSLYNSAKKVYDYEQSNLFLEEYAVDTLRLYAPVDGVELTCAPKAWNADSIFTELREAIEINTLSLKTNGQSDDYYNVDVPVSEDVRFLNSRNWTYRYEVNPSSGSLLLANPVGNQPGLGVLGFCYVTHHFVYNVKYPVLVQVQNEEEIFQFPLAVIIEGNKPRKAISDSTALAVSTPEICNYKNTELEVRTKDNSGQSVNADISYECFGEVCSIGRTSSGFLSAKFPQCVNGFIVARADGFGEKKYMFSTMQSGSVDVILDKTYKISIDLNLDGADFNDKAIISFSGDVSKTISYPEQKEVELNEGEYEIQVQIYDESSLNIQKGNYQQCMNVPSALGGIFGASEKKCFDVTVPSQIVSNALAGGGTNDYYITENELKNSNTLEINAKSLPKPESLDDLQNNYLLFEEKELDIDFT